MRLVPCAPDCGMPAKGNCESHCLILEYLSHFPAQNPIVEGRLFCDIVMSPRRPTGEVGFEMKDQLHIRARDGFHATKLDYNEHADLPAERRHLVRHCDIRRL